MLSLFSKRMASTHNTSFPLHKMLKAVRHTKLQHLKVWKFSLSPAGFITLSALGRWIVSCTDRIFCSN